MSDNQQSQTNESFLNQAEYQTIKKKITLSNQQLLSLTYHQDKFNAQLEQFNSLASRYIEDDKYPQASAYLDEAEKVLEYAAGCGKTIERCLITTILNNQACLLQRISDFEQSANYLEAIIFNIVDYLDNFHNPFSINSQIINSQSPQFIELSIYFQRKLSLALYHLRFCALSSHCKKNEIALCSAKKSLAMLKQICQEESVYKDFLMKNKSRCTIDSILQKSMKEEGKNILKQCSRIREIQDFVTEELFQKYLCNAVSNLRAYYQKLKEGVNSPNEQIENIFENYSIGNLMQASVQDIILKPNHQLFIQAQFSTLGKIYKMVHISMAYFTIATELRLISSSKYALDQQQKRNSQQYSQSKIYHLVSVIILSKFMPTKSVFFDHALSSFKNHYGINLIELAQDSNKYHYKYSINQSFQVFQNGQFQESSSSQELKESIQYNNGYGDGQDEGENNNNNTVEVHSSKQLQKMNIQNIATLCQTGMNNKQKFPFASRTKQNLCAQLKKCKSIDQDPTKYMKLNTEYSNKLQTNKSPSSNQVNPTNKNKQNKSRTKILSKSFKDKDNLMMMKSSKKVLKVTKGEQQNKRNVYYGYNNSKSKSRSKRKENLDKKAGNKTPNMLKTWDVNKRKADSRIDEEYGVAVVQSGKNANRSPNRRKKSNKVMKISYGSSEEQHGLAMKSSKIVPFQSNLRMKAAKSPRGLKQDGFTKRISVSKDKPYL